MPKFCTNCGKEIADGVAFCTACGTKAPADAAPAAQPVTPAPSPAPASTPAPAPAPTATAAPPRPQPQPAPKPAPAPAPAPAPTPAPVPQAAAPKGEKYGVVGTGAYFGLMLLFAIPVIGWIACIIIACASKNENVKHYARAFLIWLIIGVVLSAAAYLVFRLLSGSLIDYINNATGSSFGSWSDIFGGLQNGGLPMN